MFPRRAWEQEVIAIHAEAARGGDSTRWAGKFESLGVGQREELIRIRPFRHVDRNRRRCHVRIATQVVIGQRVVAAKIAVVAAEPVVPVVTHSPLLRAARGRFHFARIRLDAKVTIAQIIGGRVTP